MSDQAFIAPQTRICPKCVQPLAVVDAVLYEGRHGDQHYHQACWAQIVKADPSKAREPRWRRGDH